MLNKKVLIVCYYWPPAGGPGVQRWLKFVKYLPEYNIQPIVYVPENPSYPIYDKSLASQISKDLTVLKLPIKEPYKMAQLFSKKSANKISSGIIPSEQKQTSIQKLMLYVRGNFFIPDARKSWVEPSVKFLTDYIQKEQINTVITTGPPHSMHLIGMHLKNNLNVKWIADFRDPWTTIGYHKSLKLTSKSEAKHKQMEQQVLRAADHIIVTSNHTKNEFQTKTSTEITVITNGYDTHQIPKQQKDNAFTIAHIGSLLSDRNPKLLWQILSELIATNPDFKSEFRLKLIGIVSEDVLLSIQSFNLDAFVDNLGYLSHEDALKAQRQSRVLLLIEIDSEDTKAIIPGKLFEYMVSETPILAVGPKNSDVEQIIKSTNTGSYFTYDNKIALKAQILSYFEAYQSGGLSTFPIGLQPYSRKALTGKLAEILKSN